MTRSERHSGTRRDFGPLAVVIGVSLSIRIGYLLVKPSSVVSLDVGMWQEAATAILNGRNPYHTGTMVFLPLWPALIWAMASLSKLTGWGFSTFLWSLLILFESGIIIVAYGLLRRSGSGAMARNILLLAIALNPAAIFQVTQHGNIDVLFMFWVMLAVTAMTRFQESRNQRDWLYACACIGVGILTKTAPVALVPLLAAGASSLPRRTLRLGIIFLCGPAALGFAALMLISPPQEWINVFIYRSVHGYFGLSGLLGMIDGVEFPLMGPLVHLQSTLFNIGLPICMLIVALRMWRRGWREPSEVPLATLLILTSILVFGIGFGPQHIYWLIPLAAVTWGLIRSPAWRRLLILGWFIIVANYTFEYLIISSHGELLRTLYPQSDLLYRISLQALTPGDQTILRLPMFCFFVAMLIQGLLEMRGKSVAPARSTFIAAA